VQKMACFHSIISKMSLSFYNGSIEWLKEMANKTYTKGLGGRNIFCAKITEKRNITALLACMKNEFYVLKTTPYFSP